MSLTLVIGTRQFSSWSLRPWIALKQIGADFREILIPLRQPDTKAHILAHSPGGKVPILIDGDLTIWDSLSILEHLAERFPSHALWPADPVARVLARSVSAEMHSGFAALRKELGMEITSTLPTPDLTPEAAADVARVQKIWTDARARFGSAGPFLFGRFTNADAMYAPVATRFRTYGIQLDPVCERYVATIMDLPALAEWRDKAAQGV